MNNIDLKTISIIKVIYDIILFILNFIFLIKDYNKIFTKINFNELKLNFKHNLLYFIKRFFGYFKNKWSLQIILYLFNVRIAYKEKELFNLLINICNYYSFYLLVMFISFRMRVFYHLGQRDYESAKNKFNDIKIIIII